jgi:hypothetical protein
MENSFKCLNTVKKMNFVKIMSSVNTRNLCCNNANTRVSIYFYFEGIKVPFSWNPFGHKKLKCLSTCLRYFPRQSLQVALRNLFNNNLPHHSL